MTQSPRIVVWINVENLRQGVGELVAEKEETTLGQLMAEGGVERVEQLPDPLPTPVHGDRRKKGQKHKDQHRGQKERQPMAQHATEQPVDPGGCGR